jgi:hypothetical protein
MGMEFVSGIGTQIVQITVNFEHQQGLDHGYVQKLGWFGRFQVCTSHPCGECLAHVYSFVSFVGGGLHLYKRCVQCDHRTIAEDKQERLSTKGFTKGLSGTC